MRKVLLLALVALTTSIGFAQIKPDAGEVGIGMRVNGFLSNAAFGNWDASSNVNLDEIPFANGAIDIPQNILFGRYYYTSDIAFRFGFGINTIRETFQDDLTSQIVNNQPSGISSQSESKVTFGTLGLNLGVEKHFAQENERLDPYIGAELKTAVASKLKVETNTFNFDANNNTSTNSIDDLEVDGGGAFGISLLTGFNYFISDRFAFGGEVNFGLNYSKFGGDYTLTSNSTSGNNSTTSITSGTQSTEFDGAAVGSTGGVYVHYFF